MLAKNPRTVPASNFMSTLAANVGNLGLTDSQFRELFRNTQAIVIYDDCERIEKELKEKLSLNNLNRIFAGKEIILKNVCANGTTMGLVMGQCIRFENHPGFGVTLVITELERRYTLLPDSISKLSDKIEGFTSKDKLDRYRIELV
ncbi:MAG: hypothetical protein US25_C0026G0002 [Candidatus Moranbacteria bacterium GW2011_GWE1_36_7]|nr:MAG: hypothetical protein UR99_C0040G0002 [Candidatus Moranbacteria bacterium GW2011_GWD2_36_12]KKQ05214.1 MAG: hypothetical protein US16_C0036G0002 [Candidatus Moranbacteria bacterium GW2011_GWE2_36_40]KKQ14352.1 MAG: hypothetical protein US25_C0026G0002 [Candidatus Moranbacteria bacterium GW2011_GWE1_36_7]